jgi:hypothetical protein
VYEITVVPRITLVRVPLASTLATTGFELIHDPPVLIVVNVVLLPMQRSGLPVIEPGSGLIVTVVVLTQPVPIV